MIASRFFFYEHLGYVVLTDKFRLVACSCFFNLHKVKSTQITN